MPYVAGFYEAAKVVVVGAGFAGLQVAQGLRRAPVEITIIDRRNHHLFQPLLYQVATAALSPADIATPIRSIFRKQRNVSVVLGEVRGVDTAHREVLLDGRRVPYDNLVIATGARHCYLDRNEWSNFAPGLKSIEDATAIRGRILEAFERAENEPNPIERRALLNFVIIGGGPTGVEMAGAIAELAKRVLVKDFRNIDPRDARVMLIEAGPRILSGFHEELSRAAVHSLGRLGVEVRIDDPISHCDAQGVEVAGERISARTVVWAAGVAASPAAKWLGAEADRAGRVVVKPNLSVPNHPEIFVIGDASRCLGRDGNALPGIASVAKQQGRYVARVICSRVRHRPEPRAFSYRHYGSLATIGRKAAVADFGRVRIRGCPAWIVWSLAHVFFLVGFRNRFSVLVNWAWTYLTCEPRARLITGTHPPLTPALPTAPAELQLVATAAPEPRAA